MCKNCTVLMVISFLYGSRALITPFLDSQLSGGTRVYRHIGSFRVSPLPGVVVIP